MQASQESIKIAERKIKFCVRLVAEARDIYVNAGEDTEGDINLYNSFESLINDLEDERYKLYLLIK